MKTVVEALQEAMDAAGIPLECPRCGSAPIIDRGPLVVVKCAKLCSLGRSAPIEQFESVAVKAWNEHVREWIAAHKPTCIVCGTEQRDPDAVDNLCSAHFEAAGRPTLPLSEQFVEWLREGYEQWLACQEDV